MGYTDKFASLCGAGQDLLTAGTAGVLSSNWMDMFLSPPVPAQNLQSNNRALGGGQLVVARFGFVTQLANTVANATIDLQIVALPVTTDQPFTFTFANDTAVDPVTDRITHVAAWKPVEGQRITIATAGAFPTVSGAALAASTSYYVRNPFPSTHPVAALQNTIQLARTPGGAVIDITADGTGTTTVTYFPDIIVSKQQVPIELCGPGRSVIEVGIPPPPNAPLLGVARYLFARFVPSATMVTGGIVTCDLVGGYSQDGRPLNPVNYVTQ